MGRKTGVKSEQVLNPVNDINYKGAGLRARTVVLQLGSSAIAVLQPAGQRSSDGSEVKIEYSSASQLGARPRIYTIVVSAVQQYYKKATVTCWLCCRP